MSDTGNSDKTATAAPAKATLHLKRPVEQGLVRQSFSHGRSKAVVVEKVKRRILTPGEAAAAAVRPATAAPATALELQGSQAAVLVQRHPFVRCPQAYAENSRSLRLAHPTAHRLHQRAAHMCQRRRIQFPRIALACHARKYITLRTI